MKRLGLFFLKISYWFDRWHHVHIKIGLGLLLLAAIAQLRFPTQSEEIRELEHTVGNLTVYFFAAYLVFFLLEKVLARFWPLPLMPFFTGLPTPLLAPESGDWIFGDHLGAKFRYRFARPQDLSVFVEYSIGDPNVLLANPELDREARLALYESWHSLAPKSFMLLETSSANLPSWRALAISIVLPLSRRGAATFGSGRRRVIDLEAEDLAKSAIRPTTILVDTLITPKQDQGRAAIMVMTLTKLHCAKVWKATPRSQMEYWVEPDNPKLPKQLRDCGFEGPYQLAAGHTLFKLKHTRVLTGQSPRQRNLNKRLRQNLVECSEWRIS